MWRRKGHLFIIPRKEALMLKCLMKYEWVKLRGDTLPVDKGIMGAWAKFAASAAFRKGSASYCGHKNAVSPGM